MVPQTGEQHMKYFNSGIKILRAGNYILKYNSSFMLDSPLRLAVLIVPALRVQTLILRMRVLDPSFIT